MNQNTASDLGVLPKT